MSESSMREWMNIAKAGMMYPTADGADRFPAVSSQ